MLPVLAPTARPRNAKQFCAWVSSVTPNFDGFDIKQCIKYLFLGLLDILPLVGYLTAVIFQYYVLLPPTAWFSTSMSLLYFTPYVAPEYYLPPNCLVQNNTDPTGNVTSRSIHGSSRFFRSEVFNEDSLVPTELSKRANFESNSSDHSQRMVWMGPLGA
jgi:hypothetical protein